MNDKKLDNQKLFTTLISIILIFFFIGGFWLGLQRVRSMEGTFRPNILKEGLSLAPSSAKEAADYLSYVIKKTESNKASVSKDVYFDINKDSVTTDGSETFLSSVLFAFDNFRNHISTVEEMDDDI